MGLKATGLMKVCPRCSRIGIVFLTDNREEAEVVWPARAEGFIYKAAAEYRDNPHVTDLFNPIGGCGQDSAR